MPSKANQVGALWRHRSERAGEYFRGTVDGKPVMVFRNAYKTAKHRTRPDFIVYRGQLRPEEDQGGG